MALIPPTSGDTEPLPTLVFRDFVPASARWYTMIAGPNPGVFQGLQNIPNRAVSNAVIGRHGSEEEARKIFNEALDNGAVRRISDGSTVVLTRADVYGA
ncbi:hypothetical protein BDZ97DRAFT_1930042 [Flammula alnicola]|nr:hypothetical protein BDZ97DRAFT_1930042 [Flammula alnicola]